LAKVLDEEGIKTCFTILNVCSDQRIN